MKLGVWSRLAAMNWRRGLVLAGLNVLVALPMIGILAARDAQSLRNWKEQSAIERSWVTSAGEFPTVRTTEVPVQEEQTVTFSPCAMWESIPVQESVVQLGNLPAFVVSQWRAPCPPRWSVAGMLGVNDSGFISDVKFRAMRRVEVAFCILIAAQWFVIGGFPLVQSRRWWVEPGAFITACTAIGSSIALIPEVDVFGRLPALIAFFAWVWLLGLLIWRPVALAWQSTLGRLRRLN